MAVGELRVATFAARALSNLALVKYFGKRDLELNLPAAGSLSIALEPLSTTTTVDLDEALDADEVALNGAPAKSDFAGRVTRFLDILGELAGSRPHARVSTRNDFPTAAGLASSASGFAALAMAASRALGLDLEHDQLSALARRGSGSAARSIPGGIAVWNAGTKSDGSDSFATRIAEPEDWDLRVVVGVTDAAQKAIGSTAAMELTRKTSPFYDSWIGSCETDLAAAVRAVETRDLAALGEVSERSALAMHAAALAARPGIVFWRGATLEALRLVRRLRLEGVEAYFTCDAGPQPKVLCAPAFEDRIATELEASPGVTRVIRCRVGGGARLVPPEEA